MHGAPENGYRLDLGHRFCKKRPSHQRSPMQSPTPLPFPAHLSLANASIGEVFTVDTVRAPVAAPEWAAQLEDIGFLAGERVSIMARSLPGGDPLVVRVGLSTFALRRVEAACILVTPVAVELL